jgi:hypothetical protein
LKENFYQKYIFKIKTPRGYIYGETSIIQHPALQKHENSEFFLVLSIRNRCNYAGSGATTLPPTRHNVNLKDIALHTGKQAVPRNFGNSVHLGCDVSISEHSHPRSLAANCRSYPLLKNRRFGPLQGVTVTERVFSEVLSY